MNEEKRNQNENIKLKKGEHNTLFEVTIIILMTALVVAVSTGLVVYNNIDGITGNKIFGNNDYLDEFENAYNNILESYVETVDKKAEELKMVQ